MKKFPQSALSILLIVMLLSLSACGGDSIEDKILGSWAPFGEDEYMTFYSSGTLTVELSGEDDIEGSWSISDENMLTISLDGDELTVEVSKISSDSMTWEANGESVELLKCD